MYPNSIRIPFLPRWCWMNSMQRTHNSESFLSTKSNPREKWSVLIFSYIFTTKINEKWENNCMVHVFYFVEGSNLRPNRIWEHQISWSFLPRQFPFPNRSQYIWVRNVRRRNMPFESYITLLVYALVYVLEYTGIYP